MKFGSVFVLFNPDEEVIEKINKYSEEFTSMKIVVVDNSYNDNEYPSVFNDTVSFISNKNIGGIAGALNKGINYLISQNVDFVFTFDQDSHIPSDFFEKMQSFIYDHKADAVCPIFFDRNSETYSVFVTFNKWNYDIVESGVITSTAITSGMGISAKVWNEMEGMREDYIIDHVDTYYCLELCRKGVDIFINRDICLNHAIGERTKHKLLGVTFKPNHHSALRKYYIIRNGLHSSLYFLKDYPSYFYLNFLRTVHEFVCVIFYEKDKRKKLKLMLLGLYHGFVGKLGPYLGK
ncbi:TPA: glycosyltransferase [Klebsiella oxytoca]|nr:glycosyltransferase [Klebsiella oxytoca]HBM2878806.1 glycosyltransferase [Klebsiella oxytoca]HBM3223652.1 glycosyltransferase [Klebsiella oxytoca]